MRTTTLAAIAAGLLVLEGVAVIVVTLLEVLGLTSGGAASQTTALALIVLTAVTGLGLIAFGVAVSRGRSWGRSGGMVLQVLGVAVAFSAATSVQPFPTAFVFGLAVPGILGIILLFLVTRAAGEETRRQLDAERAENDDAPGTGA